jgi:hypothetical protein
VIKNYVKISFLLAIIYVSGAQAWVIRMVNDTDGIIGVTVTNVLCKNDVMNILPGRIGTADTFLCCYNVVTVEGKSGSIQGKKATYNPGNMCMNAYLIAQKDQVGNIILKAYKESIGAIIGEEDGIKVSIEIDNMTNDQMNVVRFVPVWWSEGHTTSDYTQYLVNRKYPLRISPIPLAPQTKILLDPQYSMCGYLIRFEVTAGSMQGKKKEIPIPCKNSKFIVKQENGELVVTVESM